MGGSSGWFPPSSPWYAPTDPGTSWLDHHQQQQLHTTLAWSVIALSPLVAAVLLYGRPPTYGKLQRPDGPPQRRGGGGDQPAAAAAAAAASSGTAQGHWLGPLLPSRWCWMVFESPNWIWTVIILLSCCRDGEGGDVDGGGGGGRGGWCPCGRSGNEDDSSPDPSLHQSSLPAVGVTVMPPSLPSLLLLLPLSHLPPANVVLLAWFTAHYLYRSLVFPLCMSPSSRFPLGAAAVAFLYCAVNGYLQVYGLLCLPPNSAPSPSPAVFLVGCSLMVGGFAVACHSDHTLLRMKREAVGRARAAELATDAAAVALKKKDDDYYCPGANHNNNINSAAGAGASPEKGPDVVNGTYRIPHGGMFEYVSCPHYLGEIVEWAGFYVASGGTLAAASFVIWTCANLVPRAVATHEWYVNRIRQQQQREQDEQDKDGDGMGSTTNIATTTDPVSVPIQHRKAIIPFIL
jgi:hypothetical protein